MNLRTKLLVVMMAGALTSLWLPACNTSNEIQNNVDSLALPPWHGWNKYQIKPEDTLVKLGHDLIEHTSYYLGPKGTIAAISNGMNCQNCHINGGIVPWGNNFSAVISTYPRMSYRSGKMMSISRRVNDCFERSMNGQALDTTSLEMRAIIAYMHWIGDGIPKGDKPLGSGTMKLPYMDRATDTAKGRTVFLNYCQRCHGKNGEGLANNVNTEYVYPPLWGDHSYNTGAGLYRLSAFAGFVKNNMPYLEANYQHPKLTNEQAWDVAAFVNSMPRPLIKNHVDYPDISKKEVDNPSGPYSDTFPEIQHKYGPFKPIADARKN